MIVDRDMFAQRPYLVASEIQSFRGHCRGFGGLQAIPQGVTARKHDKTECFFAPEGRSPYGQDRARSAYLVPVNTSRGGIPKLPVVSVRVTMSGLKGDGHNHEKHNHPLQAVCLQDIEQLQELSQRGLFIDILRKPRKGGRKW